MHQQSSIINFFAYKNTVTTKVFGLIKFREPGLRGSFRSGTSTWCHRVDAMGRQYPLRHTEGVPASLGCRYVDHSGHRIN